MDNTQKAEAVLLAQDIIKNPLAVGTAITSSQKVAGAVTYTETITYSVSHGEIKLLEGGQVDVSQLPNISISVTNTVDPSGSAPTGSLHIIMSYSGELIGAFGIFNQDDASEESPLDPPEALTIAKEAVAKVKIANDPIST